MSFTNDTNKNRVKKILETLALIEKSAAANKATDEEVTELLEPVLKAVRPPEPPPKRRGNPDSKERLDFTIMQLAQEAPLKDLTTALAVYLGRIDEHLD